MSGTEPEKPHDTVLAWWRELTPQPGHPDPQRRRGDRAALARLRRCHDLASAALEPATIELAHRLGWTHPDRLDIIALLAGVLAHLREDVRTDDRDRRAGVARQVGMRREGKGEPQPGLLSPLRFRKLLEAQPGKEQLDAFRRLLALAGGAVNAGDLVASLLDWNHPNPAVREHRCRRWVLDFHDAGAATVAPPRPDDSPAATNHEAEADAA